MCCICDESTLGLQNIYWYPDQWRHAIRRAVEYIVVTKTRVKE